MKSLLVKFGWVAATFGLLVLDQLPSAVLTLLDLLSLPAYLIEGISILVFLAVVSFFVYLGFRLKLYSREKISQGKLWLSILVGYVLLMAVQLVGLVVMRLTGNATLTNQETIKEMLGVAPISLILFAVVGAPIMEEFIFRGMIFKYWLPKHPYWAMAVSAVLFALLHTATTPAAFVMYGGMGLVYAGIYHYQGRLIYSMALHFFSNALACLLLVLQIFFG